MLHKAAYRKGLGNSIFCPKHNLGKISTETLQHYVCENFTANRGAVIGLGIDHNELIAYAKNMCFPESSSASDAPSKYYGGGEIR